jgi:hypothetical protein
MHSDDITDRPLIDLPPVDLSEQRPQQLLELLRVGDLVQYVDPIPEDMRILTEPGLIVEVKNTNYCKVKWLHKEAGKPGLYLRRELRILSRTQRTEPPEPKNKFK